jgi:hypothetical protein
MNCDVIGRSNSPRPIVILTCGIQITGIARLSPMDDDDDDDDDDDGSDIYLSVHFDTLTL